MLKTFRKCLGIPEILARGHFMLKGILDTLSIKCPKNGNCVRLGGTQIVWHYAAYPTPQRYTQPLDVLRLIS